VQDYPFRSPKLNSSCETLRVKRDYGVSTTDLPAIQVQCIYVCFVFFVVAHTLLSRYYAVAAEGRPVMRAFDTYMVARKYGLDLEFIEAFSEMQWGEGVCAGTNLGLQQMVQRVNDRQIRPQLQQPNNQRQRRQPQQHGPQLPWPEVFAAVGQPAIEAKWRTLTDRNRKIVYDSGLWGVPCISVQGISVEGTYNGHVDRDMDLEIDDRKLADNVSSVEGVATGETTFVWGQDKIWQIEEQLQRAKEAQSLRNGSRR
jgi:hypothetical protein